VGIELADLTPLLVGLGLVGVKWEETHERRYYTCDTCGTAWMTRIRLQSATGVVTLFEGSGAAQRAREQRHSGKQEGGC
jgi:DNA-binding PadR family transcriptional regulator